MGCFDTIEVPCPHCGTMYPAQSKSGECLLGEYALYDAPADVMADVNRHAPFVCHACKTVFEVDIANRQTLKLDTTAEEVRQEMLARMSCGDPSQGRNEVEANVIAMMASEKDLRGQPLTELEEAVARGANATYRATGVKIAEIPFGESAPQTDIHCKHLGTSREGLTSDVETCQICGAQRGAYHPHEVVCLKTREDAGKDADLAGWIGPGWYFYDEAYQLHGPFGTQEEAARLLQKYCDEELGGPE